SEAIEAPKIRAWLEGYGLSSKTDAQGDFAGDRRTTYGGVAGIGATPRSRVHVGISRDQSPSRNRVPPALPWGHAHRTQIGGNFSIDKGPWTLAGAIVHGVGKVNSNRDTGGGFAMANYNAAVDGAIVELDYYWMKDEFRIVPKASVEYVHSSTDAFRER